MPSAACPNCGLTFKNHTSVLKHMNHPYSSCHRWFANTSQPPPPHPHDLPGAYASHYFPDAGHVFDAGPGFLGWFHNDENAGARSANPYFPFLSKGEWEIAGFLSRSGLSMKLIDKFLSLSLVHLPQAPSFVSLMKFQIAGLDFSFHCARTLRGKIELLPSGPSWKSTEITMPGYDTKDPLVLYYRDPVECIEFLMKNPLFSGKICYQLHKVFDASGNRVYGEWITGDGAWDLQVRISPTPLPTNTNLKRFRTDSHMVQPSSA